MTENPHPRVTLALSASFRIFEARAVNFVSFCVSGGFNYYQCQLALPKLSPGQNPLQFTPTDVEEAMRGKT